MYTVGQLMTREVVCVRDDAPIETAEAMLESRRIRHLPVVHDEKLVGLITYRELARAFEHEGFDLRTPVREAMTSPVTTVAQDASLLDAIRLMLENRFGCLPVVGDDGTLVGIVTEADLLRVAAEKVAEIDRRDLAAEYEE